MQFITTLLLWTTVFAMPRPGQGDVNTGCVLMKCGSKAIACQQNASCKKVLDCSQACPKGDLNCSARCVTRYGTPQFDELTVCLQANNCITPYAIKTYKAPVNVKEVELKDIAGKYFVMLGLDQGVDCFVKQTIEITASSKENGYKKTVSITFDEGVKTLESTLRPNVPGTFIMEYKTGGGGTDQFYVIGKCNTILVVVYIGATKIATHRGGYVLKNTNAAITPEENECVVTALKDSQSDIQYSDFCKL